MATPGLSLVGFLDEPNGIHHLRNACIAADPSEAALQAEWQAARARLGAPVPNAGLPNIQPLPDQAQAHIALLRQQPWVQAAFQSSLIGASFQMVEIEPLLAFQLTVDMDRSNHHHNRSTAAPSLDELLQICLPLTNAAENVQAYPAPGAMLITSRGLNFHAVRQGLMADDAGNLLTDQSGNNFVGLAIGVRLPLLHVVRFNGRCYLHNGYHRAMGARRRGATHVPCVLRDVTTPAAVGIAAGHTFELGQLESQDPPTLAHYTQDRAYEVRLRTFTRKIHVSWAEYVTPED